jgi:hypothetical protein
MRIEGAARTAHGTAGDSCVGRLGSAGLAPRQTSRAATIVRMMTSAKRTGLSCFSLQGTVHLLKIIVLLL